MSYKKEIRIFWQVGVSRRQVDLVVSAVKLFLKHTEAEDKITVKIGEAIDLRFFKELNYFFWRGFLNGNRIMDYLSYGHQNCNPDFHAILLARSRFFMAVDGTKKMVNGLAEKGRAALVFIDQPGRLKNPYARKRITLTVIHELGHVFGLISEKRKEDVLLSFGRYRHCGRNCAMYPDTGIIDYLDLEKRIFCPECRLELKNFFSTGNEP